MRTVSSWSRAPSSLSRTAASRQGNAHDGQYVLQKLCTCHHTSQNLFSWWTVCTIKVLPLQEQEAYFQLSNGTHTLPPAVCNECHCQKGSHNVCCEQKMLRPFRRLLKFLVWLQCRRERGRWNLCCAITIFRPLRHVMTFPSMTAVSEPERPPEVVQHLRGMLASGELVNLFCSFSWGFFTLFRLFGFVHHPGGMI